jgi:SEC-C motif domain protein
MPPAKEYSNKSSCPCGSQKSLGDCCLKYIQDKSKAPTAEALMRSRYTAHVLLEIEYLWNTWSPEERIKSSKESIREWASSCEWLGLRILKTLAGSSKDENGLVSFVAIFRQNGDLHEHHEVSVFRQTPEGWLYVNHND